VNELDRNLLTGEEIVFETTKHWFAPIRASLVAILIILGALVLRWLAPTGDGFLGSIGNLMDLISVGLLLFAILWIVYNIAEFLSAHFGVTNMRVLRYEGLLRRRSSETLLPTLTDVRLDEPALGRMLGYGDLRILTASGAAGEDLFKTVAMAKELRTAIQEQKASSMTGGGATAAAAIGATPAPATPAPATPAPAPATAAPAPAPAASDTASALAALDSLKTQGLITDEEYQAKRSEILGRI
jgi:ABC-type multidrug transport system fused ATPase/permease subunit